MIKHNDVHLVINKQGVEYSLTPLVNKDVPLDAKLPTYNLNQITRFVTSSSIEHAKARNEAIRQDRNRNIAAGALAGGVMDGLSGDDSVLDGVLFGALVGASVSQRTSEPTAQVGLIFADGESLSLEVDEKGYNQLQTIALSAKPNKDIPTITTDRLSKSQINAILDDIASSKMNNGIFKGIVIATLGFVAPGTLNVILPYESIPNDPFLNILNSPYFTPSVIVLGATIAILSMFIYDRK
jgi:hypothetical protein